MSLYGIGVHGQRESVVDSAVAFIYGLKRIGLGIHNAVTKKTHGQRSHISCGKTRLTLWDDSVGQCLQFPWLLFYFFHDAFHDQTLMIGTFVVASFHIADA